MRFRRLIFFSFSFASMTRWTWLIMFRYHCSSSSSHAARSRPTNACAERPMRRGSCAYNIENTPCRVRVCSSHVACSNRKLSVLFSQCAYRNIIQHTVHARFRCDPMTYSGRFAVLFLFPISIPMSVATRTYTLHTGRSAVTEGHVYC